MYRGFNAITGKPVGTFTLEQAVSMASKPTYRAIKFVKIQDNAKGERVHQQTQQDKKVEKPMLEGIHAAGNEEEGRTDSTKLRTKEQLKNKK